eukprot:g954.t1 g954   contig10:1067562-1068469(-)
MSRAHEWLASSPSSAVTATPPSVGDTGDAQSSAVAAAPTKEMANDVQEVERLTSQLTEEERLLFDLNKAILSRGQGGSKSEDGVVVVDNKALLELADALRSYSQRRGLTSAGVGGSAIDRLQSRAAGSSSSVVSSAAAVAGGRTKMQTTNIARLSVMDLIKDARIAWNAVVRSGGGGGGKSDSSGYALGSSEGANRGGGGGLAAPVVNIDISRVLFQLRLKMMMAADAKTTLRGTSSALALDVQVSDRRQMELYLLDLLEKLTSLVPNWIHL